MAKSYIQKIKGLDSEPKDIEDAVVLLDSRHDIKIIRKYDKLANTDMVSMPNDFVDIFFQNKKGNREVHLASMPIAAMTMLFNIVLLVKENQFQAEYRPRQLELFQEEFLTVENGKAFMTLPINNISFQEISEGVVRGRIEKVRQAVKFLKDHFTEWVVSKNAKGERTDSLLSLIERPTFTRGKLHFETSVFWIEKLINLKVFNPVLLKLPELLNNSRNVMFSLYLERFEENKWFQWDYKKINQRFGLNYTDANSLAKHFLKKISADLNKNSLKSFQYKVKGDLILIMPYQLKNLASNEVDIKNETIKDNENNYLSSYIARRHKLDKVKRKSIFEKISHSEIDKRILDNAYKQFKKDCRSEKIKVTEVVGDEFLSRWNNKIYEQYKLTEQFKTHPNGYPKV